MYLNEATEEDRGLCLKKFKEFYELLIDIFFYLP